MDYEDEMLDEMEDDDDYTPGNDCPQENDDMTHRPANSYKVLSESDIKERQEDDITSVAYVLSLSRAASTLVLGHYKWNVNSAQEAWFEDEDKVRETVGLLPASGPVEAEFPNKSRKVKCRICLEACPSEKMKSAGCGHLFCCECWGGYIRISIADGPGCLRLRCPDPRCRVAVDGDMIATLAASEEDRRKYCYYLRRSYIEASKDTKWCPAPGCEHAVSYDGVYNENYDVSCLCKYAFCWNCTEEAHRPVDCETVKQWILKNSSEAENTNWILANSKPCPKCLRSIEKNNGCMHMTCTKPCEFHFCWLCLGAWSDHSEKTGGFYECNRYETAKQEGAYKEVEARREMAKNALEKYAHYFERWQSNQSSRQKALEDLHQMQTVNMDKVKGIQGINEGDREFSFLLNAWKQIVECRRVLRWTYAYGYYLPDHDTAKKQFFEYLQGQAESGLEKLHHCAETELLPFLNEDCPKQYSLSHAFLHFREKLARLTEVTKMYFENLVRALENDLSDVKFQFAGRVAVRQ